MSITSMSTRRGHHRQSRTHTLTGTRSWRTTIPMPAIYTTDTAIDTAVSDRSEAARLAMCQKLSVADTDRDQCSSGVAAWTARRSFVEHDADSAEFSSAGILDARGAAAHLRFRRRDAYRRVARIVRQCDHAHVENECADAGITHLPKARRASWSRAC
jgi:hypothetical protein